MKKFLTFLTFQVFLVFSLGSAFAGAGFGRQDSAHLRPPNTEAEIDEQLTIGKYVEDWMKLLQRSAGGFLKETKIFLSVFNDVQKKSFENYFAGFKWFKNVVFQNKQVVSDLKGKNGVNVSGNGLGVLTTVRGYSEQLASELHLEKGKHDFEKILKQGKYHNVVIIAGGKSKRNVKYTQIGKVLAKLPILNRLAGCCVHIIEPLLDIAVNIERNYQDIFMFSVIYGDALLNFNSEELDGVFEKNPKIKEGIACILLEMDIGQAHNYGFAQLANDFRITLFQEKYDAYAVKDARTKYGQECIGDDEKLRKKWLKEEGFLTKDDKILMNPAFATFGVKAFAGLALLAGVVDQNGFIEVGEDGKVKYQENNYLDDLLAGKKGKDVDCDFFRDIVPSFIQSKFWNRQKTDVEKILTNYTNLIYGIPISGDGTLRWLDTGGVKNERDLFLANAGFEDIATIFGLRKSINSKIIVSDKEIDICSYDSSIEAVEGTIHSKSLVIESVIQCKNILMEEGSQIYGVFLRGIDHLKLYKNYLLTKGAVKMDGTDYFVFRIYNQENDDTKNKKNMFGGQVISEWAKKYNLKIANAEDLFTAKLFPVISVELLEKGKAKDDLDAQLLKDLPEILEFLQHSSIVTTPPESYRKTLEAGRCASFEDVYKMPAPEAFKVHRDKIAFYVGDVMKRSVEKPSVKKKSELHSKLVPSLSAVTNLFADLFRFFKTEKPAMPIQNPEVNNINQHRHTTVTAL